MDNGRLRHMIHCGEEILPANNTLGSLLTAPEANSHVVKDNEESKKSDKKRAMEMHKEGES